MAVGRISPTSLVPLYHHIAKSIGIRIEVGELDESTRGHEQAFEARYVVDAAELDALGDALKWYPAQTSLRVG